MSKQADAKIAQKYDPQPILNVCGNCNNFISNFVDNGCGYKEEKDIRCKTGGFAVKKMGTCGLYTCKK